MNCVHRWQFSEVFLTPYGKNCCCMLMFFNAVLPLSIQYWFFWHFHLLTEISPDFLNLITLWTVHDKIPKFLEIVHSETVGLFAHAIVHKMVHLVSSLLVNDWDFGDALVIPDHDTCFQLTCSHVDAQTSAVWAFLYSPSLSESCPCVPTFLECSACIKFQMN